jgi:hypothetical protein
MGLFDFLKKVKEQKPGEVRTGDDIAVLSPADPAWNPQDPVGSLEGLRNHACRRATDVYRWYGNHKGSKKMWAQSTRALALFLTAAAGLLPVLTQILAPKTTGHWYSEPAWATVLLALAGALVALDRFFGFSTAWMRYMSAELQVLQLHEQFQLDWTAQRATWKPEGPIPAEIMSAIALVRTFVAQLDMVVRVETDTWMSEFKGALQQIDEATRAKPELPAMGAISLTVTNGDQCENGWILVLNHGAGTPFRGTSAAVPRIMPGIYATEVTGTIGGKSVGGAATVTVPSGGIGSAQITLS